MYWGGVTGMELEPGHPERKFYLTTRSYDNTLVTLVNELIY